VHICQSYHVIDIKNIKLLSSVASVLATVKWFFSALERPSLPNSTKNLIDS
jgi:hypothetical protein